MAKDLIKNRVKETTTTTGTGTVTLAGAVTGFITFASVLANSDTVFYSMDDGTNWECGLGTFTTSGTTLARTTVLFSSNANAAVNFPGPSTNVYCAPIAEYTAPMVKVVTTHAIKVANETALSSTLGNARGTGAVDLQTKRSAAAQVASGNYSVIAGGKRNTSSGDRSIVGGGYLNSSSNSFATVAGGYQNSSSYKYATVGGGILNSASSYRATVGGGSSCTASGNRSVVSGGAFNTSSGYYATVPGGRYSLADKYGQQAYASGRFAAQGDAQTSCFVARCKPTDATATELFLDGSGASKRMTLSNDTSWGFEIQCIARRTDADGTNAYWNLSGAIKRDTNAASTALVGTVVSLVNQADIGAATWTLTATADTTNGSLKLTFTGEAAKTVQVVAVCNTTETTG